MLVICLPREEDCGGISVPPPLPQLLRPVSKQRCGFDAEGSPHRWESKIKQPRCCQIYQKKVEILMVRLHHA